MCKAAFAALAIVILSLSARAADTLEEVEKKIVDRLQELPSVQFKQVEQADFEMMGMHMKTKTDATVEYVKQGEKTLFRVENHSKQSRSMEGQENSMEVTQTTISDGAYVYTVQEGEGEKNATKMKLKKPMNPFADKELFTNLKQDHTLKLLDDAKVDGEECWVIEAAPKTQDISPIARLVFSFRKDIGLAVRTVGYDKDNKEVISMNITDLKLNPTIAGERFVFKAPAGVEVREIEDEEEPASSAPSSAPASAPAPTPAAPEKPATPPEKKP